jgi:hypothetical protein
MQRHSLRALTSGFRTRNLLRFSGGAAAAVEPTSAAIALVLSSRCVYCERRRADCDFLKITPTQNKAK